MSLEFSPKQFQEYFEKSAQANLKAWELQTSYLEELVKRNTSVFADLADARVSSLQDIVGAKNFADVCETNQAFLESLRDKLKALYEENVSAFEALQAELKDTYEIDTDLVSQIQRVADEVVSTAQKVAESVTPTASAPKQKPAPKKKAAASA